MATGSRLRYGELALCDGAIGLWEEAALFGDDRALQRTSTLSVVQPLLFLHVKQVKDVEVDCDPPASAVCCKLLAVCLPQPLGGVASAIHTLL